MNPIHQTESDVLAAILRRPELLADAEGLGPADFNLDAHRLILEGMRAVQARGLLLDHRTLRLELERAGKLEGIGGSAFIGLLLDGGAPLSNIGPFIEALKDASMKRRAFEVVESLHAGLLVPGSASEAVSQAVAALSVLGDGGGEATSSEGAGLLRACSSAVESLLSGEGAGRSMGLPALDALGVRLTPGEVTVIAGSTSRGKSALGAQIALSVAKAGGRAMFASLEMSREQTLRRFVAHESGIPLDVMKARADHPATLERLTRAASQIADSGLIVADLSRDTRLSRLIASAQAAKVRGGLDVVVCDYLGLLNLDGSRRGASRYEVTTELSRSVKQAALRLNVAVILLAQLSRGPENREDGKPRLADLRDSGAIEQDADGVILIHRAPTASEGALLVSKNRSGPLGEVPILFDGAVFRFVERDQAKGRVVNFQTGAAVPAHRGGRRT